MEKGYLKRILESINAKLDLLIASQNILLKELRVARSRTDVKLAGDIEKLDNCIE